jgi:membrane protein DedA with SNARE-associated domain
MNGAGVPEGGPASAFWTGLLTWLAEHDALLLFLSVLVEEGGVPLPVPSDVAVLVAAHRAARGEMSLLSVFLIVQAATLIGASVLYWAGRRAGRPCSTATGESCTSTRPAWRRWSGWSPSTGPWP